jgi:gluconolactonase
MPQSAHMIARAALGAALLTVAMTPTRADDRKPSRPILGTIERIDPRLDAIVDPSAKMEVLANGFSWVEGPVWVKADGGYLLFSDIPPNRVLKWQEGRGTEVYLEQSGYSGPIPRPNGIGRDEPGSNALTLDPQGRLVLCQHGNRQVARMDAPLSKPQAKYVAIADRYEGKRLNSPNDLVYAPDGSLYFTDPPYGLTRKEQDPDKQLEFQGVYRVTKDGKVTLLTKELSRPNGIAFSPDHRTLYVSNSDPQRAIWMAYDVKPDGTLGGGRVFFDATSSVSPERQGLPDGMKVDSQGHLFATGPGGVFVFDKDGHHLGTFATGVATSNCAFGENGSTLFITANMSIARLPLKVKGAGF